MLWIVIGLIGGIVFGAIEGWDVGEKILFSVIYGAFGFLIGFVLLISVGSLIGFAFPTKTVVTTNNIYALNDNSGVESNFYLMHGYVDEELVIRYISNGEYGKKIYEIDTDNAYINEGKDNPYVEIHHTVFKHDWMNLFGVCWEKDVYVFYVPQGSVTNEYEIDLE